MKHPTQQAAVNVNGDWRVVAGSFIIQVSLVSAVYGTYGVFKPYVSAELAMPDWQASIGLSLTMLVGGVLSALVGAKLTPANVRKLMATGIALASASFVILANVESSAWFLFVFAIMLGLAFALASGVAISTVLASWYPFNTGKMLGFAMAPLGGLIAPALSGWAVSSLGLRNSYYCIALLFICLLPLLSIVRGNPAAIQQSKSNTTEDKGLTTRQILTDWRFLVWMLCVGSIGGYGVGIVVQLPSFTAELGLPFSFGLILLTTLGLFSFLGAPTLGYIADKKGARFATIMLLAVYASCWVVLSLKIASMPLLIVLVATMGLMSGGMMPVIAVLISSHFGSRHLPKALGIGGLVYLPLHFAVPPLLGLSYDLVNSYAPAFAWGAGFLYLFALIMFLVKDKY